MKTHGRYDYVPITARRPYTWPNGTRLAVYLGLNLEHFAFGEGLGAELAPGGPQPDILNYAWRDYGNRVGAWRMLELFDQLGLPASIIANSAMYDYLFLRSLALKKDAGAQPVQPSKPIKSTVTDEGIIELDDEGSRFDPGRRVLYVLDPGHVLDIRNRSFSVQRDDGSELIAIPHRRVGRIEVGPGVAFSHRPIELALAADIELAVIGGWGQTRGVVRSARPKRAGVQFAQARAILDEDFRVAIARRLVEARIRNQRTQLMRLNRRPEMKPVAECLDTMKRQLRNLPHLATIEALFGAEGSATAVYWPALGLLSKATAAEPFRRQRPANDPLNATINYLTGILERDVRAAIQASGLHQGFAFLHASRDRHDGLIYDLMEPFRAPLTEGLAVYLFNAKRLRADMFAMAIGGEFRISEDGRAAIIRGYEATVARRVNKPDEAGRLAWRPMMLHQARSLVRAVRQGDSDLFRPYVMEA